MELRSTAFASGKNIDNAHQTPSSSAQIHIEETVESWSRSNGTSTHIHCGLHTRTEDKFSAWSTEYLYFESELLFALGGDANSYEKELS